MRNQIWLGFVVLAVCATTIFCEDDASREPRIFAYYSTTKMTKLTTVTKTAISTCFSTAKNVVACSGRKKRMKLSDLQFAIKELQDFQSELDSTIEDSANVREKRSSLGESVPNNDEGSADLNRVERALTIWSTDFSTITLTSTATLSSYTLTVSAFCTTAGAAMSCFF